MAFCTECGADIPAGIKFCTSCGAAVGDGPQPIPAMAAVQASSAAASKPEPQPQPIPQPVYIPPAAQQQPVQAVAYQVPMRPGFQGGADAPPAPGGRYSVMGTGAYIGTMILFCIPIIGWLACIVMVFAAKNQNRRNFAKAMLVFLIAGIVLSVAAYFVFNWILETVTQYINEAAGNTFDGAGGLGGIFDIITGAGLSGN